jgi:hypothetical protein
MNSFREIREVNVRIRFTDPISALWKTGGDGAGRSPQLPLTQLSL